MNTLLATIYLILLSTVWIIFPCGPSLFINYQFINVSVATGFPQSCLKLFSIPVQRLSQAGPMRDIIWYPISRIFVPTTFSVPEIGS
ncbi:hypothetical protein B0H16DRAFT_1501263 [Mycena metata]|uniref:Uncharacterized protein n=1 Tax=Mycena metata TaxID=1033252 RepID=A0AAD7NXK7_9AGAR|nr:hypothetical protein B0H16DRAFT_1501263 [Mycena metata]